MEEKRNSNKKLINIIGVYYKKKGKYRIDIFILNTIEKIN
jgi:hypothetical protein